MRHIRDKQGFLMIEVLLATVVISVALLAVAGMFIQSTKATSNSADYTAATAIAQDYLEQIKAGLLIAPFASETKTLNYVTYTVVPEETVSGINDRLYQETVTVRWTQRGQSVSLSLTTYIVKTLPQFP
jgi:Tfp pilus assembly protein PilV